ncbi:hypothetical protein EDB83DRAFT_2428529, partial [Lactarius deliciosus]
MVPLPAAPGWQPHTSGSPSDPVDFGRSVSPAALCCESGFEVHPDTRRDDPVYGLLGV